MKEFLKQSVYFVLGLLIIIGAFALLNSNFRKKMLNPENFQFSDSISVLMIGDSEIALSLNPEFIPNSVNQSIVSEHYLYTYTRLKWFLNNNPQLKFIFLGFNYSNIAKKYDTKLTDPTQRAFFFSRVFILLDENELNLLYSPDLLFFRNYLAWKWGFPTKENMSLLLKTHFGKLTQESMPFWGSYLDGGVTYSVGRARERIFEMFGNESECGIAPLQMKYLNQIIDLCRTHQVKLILFASPLSDNFYNLIPDFYISEFQRIQNELPDDIRFLDYSRYPLPDSCFNDANHVNHYGAEIISRRVVEELASMKK